MCLLETTRVELVEAHDVTAEFVRAEGEGFDSRDEWWRAHRDFWSEGGGDKPAIPEALVVCQWLKLVAP